MQRVGRHKDRIIRRATGWYGQVVVDTGIVQPPTVPIVTAVGIDVGLSSFATLSTGEKIENPRWYQNAQHRLAFLQRIGSRRKKGSKRRRRAFNRVAVFHERIADTRAIGQRSDNVSFRVTDAFGDGFKIG